MMLRVCREYNMMRVAVVDATRVTQRENIDDQHRDTLSMLCVTRGCVDEHYRVIITYAAFAASYAIDNDAAFVMRLYLLIYAPFR